MNYSSKIVYDDEMQELLEGEGISLRVLNEVIERFLNEIPEPIMGKKSSFMIPFISNFDKRYSIYGNYQIKDQVLKFEIEMLGICLETVKINLH